MIWWKWIYKCNISCYNYEALINFLILIVNKFHRWKHKFGTRIIVINVIHFTKCQINWWMTMIQLYYIFWIVFCLFCREKSFSKCELLFSPVLESRNIVLRKGCASSRPHAENLWPFWDTIPAWENWENK